MPNSANIRSYDMEDEESIDLRELEVAYDDYLSELHDAYLDISELYGGDDVDYQEFYDEF